jgi:uncharacterized membrane protein
MAQPVFNSPVRWALRVLAWLAFGVSTYLAWTAITNTPVAGCSVGSHHGCDTVLSSTWSKWLGVPVAVPGLACYATLAGLSVLLGVQSSAGRWISTALILLATVAAGASLWFIALQLFVIGDFCRYCLAADICGIALGAIAAWAAISWWRSGGRSRIADSSSSTLMALRGAIPAGAKPATTAATRTVSTTADSATTPVPTAARPAPAKGARTVPLVGSVSTPAIARRSVLPPSIPIAYGGALALLVVLIGGQIVFPAKPFEVHQVALKDSIDLSSGGDSVSQTPDAGATHVAHRIPADGEADENSNTSTKTDAANDANSGTRQDATTNNTNAESGASKTETSPPEAEAVEPKREREITLLGGKLKLNVYDHPILGSPEAEHVIVELISYDCPHCRKSNAFVKRATSRYGNQVAVIVAMVPMESRCNPLVTDPAASHADACKAAATGLAIAKIRPSYFPRFHEFMMSGSKERPPRFESVLSKAYGWVDRNKLREVRDSKEVGKQIASYINLFGTLRNQNAKKKEFGLPIQILGDHVLAGGIEKADDLYKAWEEHLGVKPR